MAMYVYHIRFRQPDPSKPPITLRIKATSAMHAMRTACILMCTRDVSYTNCAITHCMPARRNKALKYLRKAQRTIAMLDKQ